MNCRKCKKEFKVTELKAKRYGYVSELKHIGHFMKQYAMLCKDCFKEV